MSSVITINFANGTAANSPVSVRLTDCAVATDAANGVSLQASIVTNIAITSNEISFATGVGAVFSGALYILIDWTNAATPQVTLTNLENGSDTATVGWPTAKGPQSQILSPGNPVALAGIVAQ